MSPKGLKAPEKFRVGGGATLISLIFPGCNVNICFNISVGKPGFNSSYHTNPHSIDCGDTGGNSVSVLCPHSGLEQMSSHPSHPICTWLPESPTLTRSIVCTVGPSGSHQLRGSVKDDPGCTALSSGGLRTPRERLPAHQRKARGKCARPHVPNLRHLAWVHGIPFMQRSRG